MSSEPGQSIFEQVGAEPIRRIVAAFYRRVPTDDVLGPMYPADDLVGAEQRLFLFLLYRLGGPPTYLEQRGHPALRMRHAPFAINQLARDRWMLHMQSAIEEHIDDAEVRQALVEFLAGVATFLINQPG